MAIDPAWEIYQRLEQNGLLEIQRMLEEQEQESQFLDFKGARRETAPMEEDDRKTLGEALSGFANTEGGVIVWGVDCRQGADRDDPDVVQGLKPIRNIRRWLSDLQAYEHKVASPPLAGVRHALIIDPTLGDDVGYAATYVPKSEGQPVMAIAKMKEQYSYFVRSGSSFSKMPHSMVADRFGRRPHPELKVSLASRSSKEEGGTTLLEFILGIKNVGRGLALYPALLFRPLGRLTFSKYGLDGSDRDGMERQRQAFRRYGLPEERLYSGGVNDVIHPSTTREITKVTLSFQPLDLLQGDGVSLRFEFELYAEGYSRKGSGLHPLNRELAIMQPEINVEV